MDFLPGTEDDSGIGNITNQLELNQMVAHVEKKFKDRYTLLKKLYEQRISSLTRQVKLTYNTLSADPILETMKNDPTSASFVNSRTKEIVTDSLSNEREMQISRLTEQVANYHAELHDSKMQTNQANKAVKQVSAAANSKIHSLQNELKAKMAEVANLNKVNGLLEKRALKAENHIAELEKVRDAEKDEMKIAVEKLKGMMRNSEPRDRSASIQNLVSDISERVSSTDKLLLEKETQLKQTTTITTSEIDKMQKQITSLVALNDNLTKQCQLEKANAQKLQNQLSKAEVLLERSETERLELRQQYMSLGEKLEKIISSDNNECAKLKDTIDKLKVRHSNEQTEITAVHHKTVSAYKSKVDSLEHEIKSIHISAAENATLKQQVEICNDEIHTLSSKLRKLRNEHDRELSKVNEAHRNTVDELHKNYDTKLQEQQRRYIEDRKRWEDELRKETTHSQQELREQYKKLMDSKLAELAATQQSAQQASQRVVTDEVRLNEALAAKLRDYVSNVQHHDTLLTKVNAAKMEAAEEKNKLVQHYEEKLRVAISDLTERKKEEYALAMLNVRAGLRKLESQLEEERQLRKDADAALDEDRRALAGYRQRSDEDERKKRKLVDHLEEASHNINRLKRIVDASNAKCAEAEAVRDQAVHIRDKAVHEAKSAKDMLETLQTRFDQMEKDNVQRRELAAGKISKLETTVLNLKAANQELHLQVEANFASHAEQLEQEQTKRSTVEEKAEVLQQQRQRSEAEHGLLQQKLNDLLLERRRLIDDKETLIGRVASSEAAREEAAAAVQDTLKLLGSTKSEYESKLEQQAAEIVELQSSLQADQQRFNTLSQRRKQQHKQLAALLEELKQLKAELKDFKCNSLFQLERCQADMALHTKELRWNAKERLVELRKDWQAATELKLQQQREAFDLELAKATAEHDRQRQQQELHLQEAVDRTMKGADQRIEIELNGIASEREKFSLVSKTLEETSIELRKTQVDRDAALDGVANLERRVDDLLSQLRQADSSKYEVESSLKQRSDQSLDLSKQLDSRTSNFLAVLSALNSEIALSQNVLDGLMHVDTEKFSHSLANFHADIRRAIEARSEAHSAPLKLKLEETEKQIAHYHDLEAKNKNFLETCSKTEDELKLQNQQLLVQLGDSQKEVDRLRAEISALTESMHKDQEEQQAMHSVTVMDLESEVRMLKNQLDELQDEFDSEKQRWIKKAQQQIQRTQKEANEEAEQLRREMQAQEETLSTKLEREKMISSSLRKDLLRTSQEAEKSVLEERSKLDDYARESQRSFVDLERSRIDLDRSNMSFVSKVASLSLSPRKRRHHSPRHRHRRHSRLSSSVGSTEAARSSDDLHQLLERSHALDSAAQQIISKIDELDQSRDRDRLSAEDLI